MSLAQALYSLNDNQIFPLLLTRFLTIQLLGTLIHTLKTLLIGAPSGTLIIMKGLIIFGKYILMTQYISADYLKVENILQEQESMGKRKLENKL